MANPLVRLWRAISRKPAPLPMEEIIQRAMTERTASLVAAGLGTQQANTAMVTASKSAANPFAAPAMTPGRQTQPINFNPFGLSTYNFIWRKEYQDVDLSTLDVSQYEASY